MKKLTILSAVTALFLLVNVPQARAQATIDLGVRGSYDVDNYQSPAIGAGLRISTIALPIVINPTFDYYFLDEDELGGLSFFQVTLNALFGFGLQNQVFTPYAGGGLSISRYSVDDGVVLGFDADDTVLGLNLVGGAEFGLGALTPFVQAQFVVGGDQPPASITAGLLFSLSR